MKFHELLKELQNLRVEWRRQDFKFTKEQKQRYEFLQELRRARVSYFYENGLVSKGGKSSSQDK
jgi:hypothetical protein